jgi:NADPH:quinone reductase-like Zn-dependent oxidoreductase
VTAVCSAANRKQALSLGADHAIDYASEDFTRSGKRYDLIVGVNGYHPIMDYKRALKEDGMYIMIGGNAKQMFQPMILGPLITAGSRKKVIILSAKSNREDLEYLKDLIMEGRIRPVIDRKFSLDQVPDAMRYQGEGHAHGKIVITMT